MRRRMPDGLREDVEAAVLDEVERVGLDRFQREVIVARFLDQAGKTFLYRVVGEILASGTPGEHVARKIKAAVAERAARTPEPVMDAARQVADMLPSVVTIADMSATGGGGVIDRLMVVMTDLERLTAYAKTAAGDVRNAKLLLLTSRETRQCLETAVKLKEAIRQDSDLERFHGLVIQAIARVSPQAAEEIVRDVTALSARWTGSGSAPQ